MLDIYQPKPTKGLLVVEDHPIIQRTYQTQFQRLCYSFDVVSTGKEALHALMVTHYRLILLDVGLSDIDGRELCRRIREDIPLNHLHQPIVMASAAGDSVRTDCLQAGAHHFFIKTDILSSSFKVMLQHYLNSSP